MADPTLAAIAALERALTPQERRLLFHTRAGGPHRGHAAAPGSGPQGETCGSCRHLARNRPSSRAYLKCGLMEAAWTGGAGTDVRARDPACSQWQAPTSPPEAADD
jgi:hypothetical protein